MPNPIARSTCHQLQRRLGHSANACGEAHRGSAGSVFRSSADVKAADDSVGKVGLGRNVH